MSIDAVVTQGSNITATVNVSTQNFSALASQGAKTSVSVVDQTLTTAKVTPQQEVLVTRGLINTGNMELADLVDVVVGMPKDGSLLTYNGDSGKWEAKTIIENKNTEFNGGHF